MHHIKRHKLRWWRQQEPTVHPETEIKSDLIFISIKERIKPIGRQIPCCQHEHRQSTYDFFHTAYTNQIKKLIQDNLLKFLIF